MRKIIDKDYWENYYQFLDWFVKEWINNRRGEQSSCACHTGRSVPNISHTWRTQPKNVGIGSMRGRFARRGWRRMPGRHFANFARVAVRKFYVHSSML